MPVDCLALKKRMHGPNLHSMFKLHEIRSIVSQENHCTRCQILRLKCTKFDFGWGSAPDPAGGAYNAPPDPLAGFKGPTSKGKGGEGRGEEERGEGRKGKGEGWAPSARWAQGPQNTLRRLLSPQWARAYLIPGGIGPHLAAEWAQAPSPIKPGITPGH